MTRIAFAKMIALAVTGVALIVTGRKRWQEADVLYDLKWLPEYTKRPDTPVKISAEEHSKRVYLGCSGIMLGILILVVSAMPVLVRVNRILVCGRGR